MKHVAFHLLFHFTSHVSQVLLISPVLMVIMIMDDGIIMILLVCVQKKRKYQSITYT